MIIITDSAWNKITEKLQKSGYKNLRIQVNNKGCGGTSYEFKPTNEDQTINDYFIENNGYKVLITDKVSQLIENGKLDWVMHDSFNQGFDIIDNENEIGRCGCGESVLLK